MISLRPRLVDAPADLPVSTADAKKHLRIDHTEDDALIEALITGATSYLDGHSGILGRCVVAQTWRQDFTGWAGELRLPFPDVDPDSLVITYRDADDAEQTVSPDGYELVEDALSGLVVFRPVFTRPGVASSRRAPITVTFEAGFGEADDVPGAVKSAILLIVGDLYENRENTVIGQVTVSEMPLGAHMLIAPWRRSGC